VPVTVVAETVSKSTIVDSDETCTEDVNCLLLLINADGVFEEEEDFASSISEIVGSVCVALASNEAGTTEDKDDEDVQAGRGIKCGCDRTASKDVKLDDDDSSSACHE